MTYKHSNPVHLKFGKTGDSSLLRKGYADGGAVSPPEFESAPPGSTQCAAHGDVGGAAPGVPWCGSPEDVENRRKAGQR
jgi:hypothetical protein